MAIEPPGFVVKTMNLMGLRFPGTSEDGASQSGDVLSEQATKLQPAVANAKDQSKQAASAVEGRTGTAMSQVFDDPQGALNNLDLHVNGARVGALILKVPVSGGVTVLKVSKIIDAAVTATNVAIAMAIPGGQPLAMAELAAGKATQNALLNTACECFFGSGSDTGNDSNTAAA